MKKILAAREQTTCVERYRKKRDGRVHDRIKVFCRKNIFRPGMMLFWASL